ncbi:MAG: hypothetical protein ACRDWI_01635 [Jiangellaceae bacterium]
MRGARRGDCRPTRRNLYILVRRWWEMKNQEVQHGRGFTGDKTAWVRLARRAILDLLEDELAVVHAELEARLFEGGAPVDGTPIHFDPHILTDALRELRTLGAVSEIPHITKGLVPTTVLVPADQRRRATYIRQAVRRKAMLYTRFLRLANQKMGPVGEEVVRASLVNAGPHLRPMTAGYGEVHRVMGVTLTGALDSGAWLHTIDPATELPRLAHALPIETKNRRLVLYPIHKEVHQLLSKAATMQAKHPAYPVVPVLVCRRAHPWLFWMAKDLGFLVHETKRQFTTLIKGITGRHLQEIRDELFLRDLTLVTKTQMPLIREFFERTVLKTAHTAAHRWSAAAPVVSVYAAKLRVDDVGSATRQEIIRDLRQHLEQVMPLAGFDEPFLSWSLPDLEDIPD